jgi:hypothetical protein
VENEGFDAPVEDPINQELGVPAVPDQQPVMELQKAINEIPGRGPTLSSSRGHFRGVLKKFKNFCSRCIVTISWRERTGIKKIKEIHYLDNRKGKDLFDDGQ